MKYFKSRLIALLYKITKKKKYINIQVILDDKFKHPTYTNLKLLLIHYLYHDI